MFVVTISGVENPKSHLRWESQIRTFRNSVVQSVGQRTETSRRLMLGKKQPQDKWGGAHGKGKGIRITRVQKMLLLLFLLQLLLLLSKSSISFVSFSKAISRCDNNP